MERFMDSSSRNKYGLPNEVTDKFYHVLSI